MEIVEAGILLTPSGTPGHASVLPQAVSGPTHQTFGYACALRFLLPFGLVLATSCGGPPVEEGPFFPTWDAGGDVPVGIVQGVLVEEDRCLYLQTNGRRTLVVWEAGLGVRGRRTP